VCNGAVKTAVCEAPLDMATARAVLDEIARLREARLAFDALDSGEMLLPTRDLRATESLVLDATMFATEHPACEDSGADAGSRAATCIETVFSRALTEGPWWSNVSVYIARSNLPAGEVCSETAPNRGCVKITIAAGTTLRFARSQLVSAHEGTTRHAIHLVAACNAPCLEDELRCGASTTCINKRSFCMLCDGADRARCECQDSCLAKAPGATCERLGSEDFGSAGVCNTAGTCELVSQ
jgi:hypothetical protein